MLAYKSRVSLFPIEPYKRKARKIICFFYYYHHLLGHPSSTGYTGLTWPPHNSCLDYAQMLAQAQCTGIIEIRVYTQSRSQSLQWNVSKKALEYFKIGARKIWFQLNSCACISVLLTRHLTTLRNSCLQQAYPKTMSPLKIWQILPPQ